MPTDSTLPRDIADLQRRTRALESVPRERPWYNVRLFGATGDGVTDDYDSIQTAITAAEVAGGTVYFPPGGVYKLNKTTAGGLKLARDNTGLRAPVVLSGYGAGIKLSTDVPRFLDFNKVADHDVFRNIVIEGFEIDADNIGGVHHVIIGSHMGAGVTLSRYNVDRLLVRDVRTFNVLQDDATGTNHRLNVHINVNRTAAGTGTDGAANYLTNIRFENVRMEGGNEGIFVGGGGAAVLGLEIYMDEVHINNCWHDTGTVPTGSYASANFQLCSRAYGKNCSIQNSVGKNSGDVGIEINALTYVLLSNIVIENAYNNAYYLRHYSTLEDPGEQKIILRNCHGRTTISAGYGFNLPAVGTASASAHGRIIMEDCSWYIDATSPWLVGGIQTAGGVFEEINIVRFTVFVETFDYAGAGAYVWNMNQISGDIKIRDARVTVAGVHSGAGSFSVNAFALYPDGDLDIDGILTNLTVTTSTTGGLNAITLGSSASTVTGTIRRVEVISSGDSAPRGILIYGTGTLTIPDALFIEDCNFSALGAGGTEVLFVSANQNKDKVFFRSNVWLTFPAIAVAITPGASPYTYQNINGYKQTVTVSGGTVTVIAMSVDGTNFYTTGLIAGAFVLSNADRLKVTYSVVPTMTQLPHKH